MACAQHGSASNDCCHFSFIYSAASQKVIFFSLISRSFFHLLRVCVSLRFEGLLLFTYLKFCCVFFSIPFLILFNFSFQISRPQVVSDKAKADWRKLLYFILFLFIFFLLLNCSVLLRTLVAALFRRDPVIVVVVAF